MTGKQLKNAILQFAIQGKLVAQDPSDEPASALLARIRKEKEQLLKAGKLKKKDLETTPIADDEKPFEIPESWEWVRLKDICIKIVDGDHNPPAGLSIKTKYLMLSSKNVNFDRLVELDSVRYLSKEIFEIENQRTDAKVGDILFTSVGTLGRSCIIEQNNLNICFQRSVSLINTLTYNKYLKRCLDSPYIQFFVVENATGTAQKGFYLSQMEKLVIPLPPLAEQRRIVAKIEELMPLVEEFGAAQEKLDRLNGTLPEALKKSILQQAIQGKLVPQDANDEPASALLAQIRKEKEQLVKAGKLKKKDLATTPITDEEKPFEIPESWEWCRLGDCVSNRAGLAYNKGDLDKKTSDMIRVLRGGNIFYGGWKKEDNDVMIAREFVNDDLLLKKGTFITPAVTSLENMGKTALIDEDLYDTVVGGFVLMLQSFLYENSLLKYLLYFFCSAYYKEYCKSITNKSGQAFYNISRAKLMNLPIPIPPLAEQRRIVARVEELMEMVEGMEGEEKKSDRR